MLCGRIAISADASCMLKKHILNSIFRLQTASQKKKKHLDTHVIITHANTEPYINTYFLWHQMCAHALWAIKYSVYVAHCKWHAGWMCAHTNRDAAQPYEHTNTQTPTHPDGR